MCLKSSWPVLLCAVAFAALPKVIRTCCRRKAASGVRAVSAPDPGSVPASPERQQSAREFVQSSLVRYSTYHAHKETMAYGGFTVFAGAVTAALVSNAWPPAWGPFTPTLAPAAALIAFGLTLAYLRFQLHRRRWAALRSAGCEKVLAIWLQHAPTTAELRTRKPPDSPTASLAKRLADFVWPRHDSIRAVETGTTRVGDTDAPIYPTVLVDAWTDASTKALIHERLLIGAAWVLGIALFVRSWSCPCELPDMAALFAR